MKNQSDFNNLANSLLASIKHPLKVELNLGQLTFLLSNDSVGDKPLFKYCSDDGGLYISNSALVEIGIQKSEITEWIKVLLVMMARKQDEEGVFIATTIGAQGMEIASNYASSMRTKP